MFAQVSCLSTRYPNSTAPLPPPPLTTVPSLHHDSLIRLPQVCLAKLYDQPLLSQRRIISNEPTAKRSPLGDHFTLVITWSYGALWYS